MTPHIETKKGDIASVVLMPGDPKRAMYVALKYLDDYKLINDVRCIYGFTGNYKGKKVTVMASGMGNPSMGIYSYELFNVYGVEAIIRIGSTGSFKKDIKLHDLILVENSYSDSNYRLIQSGNSERIISSSLVLNEKIENTAKELGQKLIKGNIYSTDVFYKDYHSEKEDILDSCLGAEMETFALFSNAKLLNKKAAALLTVSDNLVTKEELSPEERENSFNEMIKLALETAIKL